MGKKAHTKSGLTAAQEKFCQAYALSGNGVEAYRAAFPRARKSKDATVAAMASKLRSQANVRQRISALAERVERVAEEKFDITAEKVLQEIANIAFANLGDYLEWGTRKVPRTHTKTNEIITDQDGNAVVDYEPYNYIKPSKELTPKQRACVVGASISYSKDGQPSLEIKMAPKLDALKALGQHLSLFKMGIEATGKGGSPIQVILSSADANL